MINRWIEQPSPSDGTLIEQASNQGMGIIAFSALAQGLLTDRYLGGVPTDSRAARGGSLPAETLTDELVSRLRSLNVIAQRRGQSLAQLAIAWVLRTARKLDASEDVLHGVQRRQRAFIENATDAIFIADVTGHFVDVNPAVVSLLNERGGIFDLSYAIELEQSAQGFNSYHVEIKPRQEDAP